MKYYIKQKVFSFGDKFTIKDEQGNDRFTVQGEVFSLGKKLHVYNMAGVEMAYVHQKLLTFMPKYEVYINGGFAMEVKKEMTFMRPKFSLLNTDIKISGDFLGHEYEFSNPQMPLAYVSKHWFSWGDSYEINIVSDVSHLYILAAVLAIDAAISSK